MPSRKKQSKLNGHSPATQHDLALWGGQLALQLEEKASKKDLDRFATKEDLKRFATKEDLEGFATKEELKNELQKYATKQDLQESEGRIIAEIQALREHDQEELDAVHQDELDIIAGKKTASPQWKSIPRRLKALEMDVEKIKYKLA